MEKKEKKSEKSLDDLLSEDFKPAENEKHLYHVRLDKPGFDPTTGKKLTPAFDQTFTVPEFKQFKAHSESLGYLIEVIWNPEN